jgi:hypothetical protein
VKHRIAFSNLPLLAVFLVLASTAALASSTWYVDGVNGSDKNNCNTAQTACKTIGHAISLAHSGDSIMVAAATYAENLTIGFGLRLVGSGAKTTIIDGRRRFSTVVAIPSANAHVTLSKVTIQNGYRGGINNEGTLTISNSTISGNVSFIGGGISNSGTLTISNSTLSGNTAHYGGGIRNQGKLTISNSTLAQNSAGPISGHGGYGGGIDNYLGRVTISNSSLSGNSGILAGGIRNLQGTAIFQNSIVANSTSGGNCYGTITSKGYNLSSDSTCDFSNSGDLNNTDPKLGPLQDNGGPTQTVALLSESPAIDAGNPGGCTDGQGHLLKTDQRGMPRPDREDTGGCDMGAFEEQSDRCTPFGGRCGPGLPPCCPAPFPHHSFCSSKYGFGRCLESLPNPVEPL